MYMLPRRLPPRFPSLVIALTLASAGLVVVRTRPGQQSPGGRMGHQPRQRREPSAEVECARLRGDKHPSRGRWFHVLLRLRRKSDGPDRGDRDTGVADQFGPGAVAWLARRCRQHGLHRGSGRSGLRRESVVRSAEVVDPDRDYAERVGLFVAGDSRQHTHHRECVVPGVLASLATVPGQRRGIGCNDRRDQVAGAGLHWYLYRRLRLVECRGRHQSPRGLHRHRAVLHGSGRSDVRFAGSDQLRHGGHRLVAAVHRR